MHYIKILTCNLVGHVLSTTDSAGRGLLLSVIDKNRPAQPSNVFLAISPGLYEEFGGNIGYSGTGTLFGIPFIVLKGNPGHYVFWATQYEAMSASKLNVNTIIKTNKDFYIF